MKRLVPICLILLGVILSGCDFGGLTNPNYGSPFGSNNRIIYKGYTYTNNYGNSVNDKYITFTGIGSRGYINGYNAYGIIDSTFSYSNNYGIGSLRHTDTLYFAEDSYGNIKFLSYGYYRVIPRWIDLITFADTNRYTYQNYDETINGQRWKLQIRNHLTYTTVYTGFGSFPAYRLEQYLDYDAPYSTTHTFIWYWNVNFGLMIYDERRDGLIYQVAEEKNF
jgi:hypothetical protein